jgi:arsenical pump membrane protein
VIAAAVPEIVALALLAAVLTFAMARPRGLPEAAVALPCAGLTVLFGLVSPAQALVRVRELGPTVGFLAAILVLAHLAEVEGVFRWLGGRLARAGSVRPGRLLSLVFLAASVTTAVLSLDATVVLLTPVVLGTATRLRLRPAPHVYACGHLANSASLLLPVSNLTNLLAFATTGLSFLSFAALMTLPWVATIAVEYLLFRVFFRADLAGHAQPAQPSDVPTPMFALVTLALTLAAFGVSGLVGVEPVWVAAVGAAVLAARALATGRVAAAGIVRSAAPLFCLFVLALGVVVTGVTAHGLGAGLAEVMPTLPTLPGLLVAAGLAAVLANVVNNLPATLALLGALGGTVHPGLVLAMLLGVNIGPNLSYAGSLATLLWRRVLDRSGEPDVSLTVGRFTRLGLLTVPACLLAAVLALWLSLAVGRGWLV